MEDYETPQILSVGDPGPGDQAVCTWVAWVIVAVYAAAATVAGVAVAVAAVAGAWFWPN